MKNKIIVFLIGLTITLSDYTFTNAQENLTITEAINQAADMSFRNIDSALYLANQALVMSQKNNDHALAFCAYRVIGSIYEDHNKLKEAKKAYAEALTIAEFHLESDDKLTIYTDWAIIHKKLGQYAVAREYHLRTVEQAEKNSNWERAEDGYHGLGILYAMIGDFEQSVQYYLESIKVAEKWEHQEGIVFTHQNISNTYLKAQNYDMALRNIEATYQMALKLGDSLRLANVLRVYGNIKTAVKDYDDALVKHEAAKSIFEVKGNEECLAETYLSIGDIYFQLKNYAQAEFYFSECTYRAEFLPNYTRAECFNKFGNLFQIQDKIPEAIAAFQESLNITDALGFNEIARENNLALANIYEEKNQPDSAYVYLKKADKLGVALFQEKKQKGLAPSNNSSVSPLFFAGFW
jgi:tetratricopeptide (TPR) repeat protein